MEASSRRGGAETREPLGLTEHPKPRIELTALPASVPPSTLPHVPDSPPLLSRAEAWAKGGGLFRKRESLFLQ